MYGPHPVLPVDNRASTSEDEPLEEEVGDTANTAEVSQRIRSFQLLTSKVFAEAGKNIKKSQDTQKDYGETWLQSHTPCWEQSAPVESEEGQPKGRKMQWPLGRPFLSRVHKRKWHLPAQNDARKDLETKGTWM